MTGAPSFSYPDYSPAPANEALLIANVGVARENARSALMGEGWRVPPGFRLGEEVTVPPSAQLVWLELDGTVDGNAVRHLARLNHDAGSGRYAAVVAATSPWIDLVAAQVTSPSVQLLIDPSPVERITSIALASAAVQVGGVQETSPERTEVRLKQLSDEVNRIASALARLSNTPVSLDTARPVQPGEGPAVSAETVRSIIRARRLRDQFIPGDLFADPAWDILLDLLQAEIIQHRVPVSSLCIASAVPATTALRWIRTMTDRDLLMRREDPHDARRVFIELAPPTSLALRRYFDKVGPQTVI
ncbi:MarR family winged helix-turn-helix transcriptional regulator [Sphingomonas sp. BN140010]|uniref:MarR family winged helix-turn-helix transcriptional regulator n=1 Tax=Sphingomonas arvum TaxID=2992113 RepID=A0ABT3JHQ0_9SPHN|nr:MarR family winged helix-turn-helix transcriptional regulator [Sphingomonas sp. BN140010]MCW3798602.1 MarR family winged helix-turn-helix transcriptional regulator [Sphingomonas sp. BN140010]